jgi:ankyrin repeat protein
MNQIYYIFKDGWTSLMFAANRGHETIVKMLLAAQAKVDAVAERLKVLYYSVLSYDYL